MPVLLPPDRDGRELGHLAAAGHAGLPARDARARVAAPAHQGLHEQQAVVIVLWGALGSPARVSTVSSLPLTTISRGSRQALADARAVEQTAGDGVDAGGAGVRRVEVAGRRGGRVDAPGGEDPLQLGEGEDLVDAPATSGSQDLRLLGHAGPDEHAADVLPVALLDRERRGDHGGDDGHDAVA